MLKGSASPEWLENGLSLRKGDFTACFLLRSSVTPTAQRTGDVVKEMDSVAKSCGCPGSPCMSYAALMRVRGTGGKCLRRRREDSMSESIRAH